MPTRDPGDPTDPTGRSGRPVQDQAAPDPHTTATPAVARTTPTNTGAAAPTRNGGSSASYPAGSYKTLTGDPAQGAVPAGEYNVLESLMAEWEAITGYQFEPSNDSLLMMANMGVETLADFGRVMAGDPHAADLYKTMPWARYGLTKDEYASAANTFGTEYKKITGQDISPDALQAAFQNPRDPTGGLLNTSQYAQQLMNDAAIQKQFGWVKYGLDFSAWTQQKLSLRGAFGRDINDSEAATILQYQKTASGPNVGAVARTQGQQTQPPSALGVAGSVAR